MSESGAPLVTVLITARNRPGELRQTLAELRRQNYRPLELLVIDDASDDSLQSVASECWPQGRFVRNERNLGLIASRSAGMRIATGAYVCSLDDDSCFVHSDALERAVARMEEEKEVGVMSFFVHHARKLPERSDPPPLERYAASYIGCAHMIRREVIDDLGGYRDFYFYYGEEAEYSLRALESGWRILFYPDVVVHHRVSPAGRDQSRVLAYSFRNNLFTILLNMPWRRAVPELAWKSATYSLEAVRRLQFRPILWALISLTAHLREVGRARRPVSQMTLLLYDALRFTSIASSEAFRQPPRVGLVQRLAWFRTAWWQRRRARPFWDRRQGGTGGSETAAFGEVKGS